MAKRFRLITILAILLFSFILISCSNIQRNNATNENRLTNEIVEVTRVLRETVEVTKLVSQKVIETKMIIVTATPKPAISTPVETLNSNESAISDGGIVIVQYYTLLDYGLYKEAYQLLSKNGLGSWANPSFEGYLNTDDYISMVKESFKSVKTITVQPYNDFAKQMQFPLLTVTPNRNFYYITIILEGHLLTRFIELVRDEGQWKIGSFRSTPPGN